MASNFDFYEKAFDKLNAMLSTYVSDVSSNIISAISPVAKILLAIYVALYGWSIIRGIISEPLSDGVMRIMRLAFITGAALNIGYYNGYLADLLWNSPDALAGFVASDHSNGNTNMQFLDSLMGQFYDIGQSYNDSANADTGVTGIPDLSLWATGWVLWIAGTIVTGYAAFLLVLSKMALAIILGIGPMFVLLTIFEPTKRFFDAWLGQSLNYVFLTMLTAGAIKLIITILQSYLTALAPAGGETVLSDPSVNQAIPAIALCGIAALVMMQLNSIASALGGGVSLGTLGAASALFNKAKSGISAIPKRPTDIRRSMNKARSDVRIAKGAASAVRGAPKAVYRRITGGNKNKVSKG